MTRIQLMNIATQVYPDAITWDMLDALTEDPDILMRAIKEIKDLPLFSQLQEEKLMLFTMECWAVGHLRIHGISSYLKFVNWTDIIYALIKVYEPQFKPENHI